MPGASCAPQGLEEGNVYVPQASLLQQAGTQSSDLRVLGLRMPVCLVTNTPVSKRENRAQGL